VAHDCLFCKIAAGEIPSSKVYEDEDVLAFRDINPVAPVHVLVIPKQHLGSVADLRPEHTELLAKLFAAVQRVAAETGVAETGYRVVTNHGKDSGQQVLHLHLHVLGGRTLGPVA
jgi:HIT domain.